MAGCCKESNVTQGLGQVLLNGAQNTVKWQGLVRTVMLHGLGLSKVSLNGGQDMVNWQAVLSTIILHMAMEFDRFF